MAQYLKGYDGAFNGAQIVHGIVTGRAPALHGRRASALVPPLMDPRSRPNADIETMVARAIEVIGGREDAMRWLGAPLRALDYATPISRLHNPAGQEQVLAVLTQLEHGVL